MKQRLIVYTFLAVTLLSACAKETATPNNQNPTPTTPPKELILGTWSYVSVTSDDPDNPTPLQQCSEDDLLTFKSDGTWMPDFSGTICDTTTTPTPGTWNVDNYPALVIKHPLMTFRQENKIIQLDATTLKYERKYPDVNNHIMTFTMNRK